MKRNHLAITIILVLIFGLRPAFAGNNLSSLRAERHLRQISIPQNSLTPQFDSDLIVLKTLGFDELRLSESISPAAFFQRHSSFVRISGDRMLAVWEDDRNGSSKIFAQILDGTGNKSGGNLLIIGRTDGYDLLEPKACSDGAGGFYLAYRDHMTGRIYAAGYNSSLTQTVAPFAVNDTISFNYAGPFDITCFTDGRLVVVWEEYSTGNNIALRIFNSSGSPLTSAIKVNGDLNDAHHWSPSVAIGGNASIGVAWEDYRNGGPDIYMRLLNQDGSPNGADFGLVEILSLDSAQYLPEIAYSVTDGYAIAWLDKRADSQKVYLQRVVTGSGLVGPNTEISSSATEVSDWDISLGINSANNLVASWAAVGASSHIVIQNFTLNFVPSGAPFVASIDSSGSRWETSVGIGPVDRIFCGWTDSRAHHSDIYFRAYSTAGTELFSGDRLLNDDVTGAPSVEPDITLLDDSHAVVVFTDRRFDEGDIFLQLVDRDGTLSGTNIKINSDLPPALQTEPAIGASSSAMLAVWNDARAVGGVSGQHIFGRFGDISGVLSPSDFIISDENDVSQKGSPSVALSGSGGLAVWLERLNPDDRVMGRLVTAPGTAVDTQFPISDSTVDLAITDMSVIGDRDGNYVIAYLTYYPAPTVVVARYSPLGAPLGRFSYSSMLPNIYMTGLSAAVGKANEIIIFWQGEAVDQSRHIYLSKFSPAGAVLIPPFEIPVPVGAGPQDIDVSSDADGYVIAAWVDSRSGKRAAYYQVYTVHLNPGTSQLPASLSSTEYMISPTVAGRNWDGWLGWVDPRAEGQNIYVSQFNYLSTDISGIESEIIPDDFALSQNYPNPFNLSTSIQFDLPHRGDVRLEIFNLLGRKIKTLLDENLEAGKHQILWDGTDSNGKILPSGLYFYRMKSDHYSSVRKMVLLK